jgi:hypothetical protein
MEESLSPLAGEKRVVTIVGMHRSGTSCLAGTLEEAGLHLGRVITEAPHNAKGNRENRSIMDLQEEVLVHSGGSWDKPPARLAWSSEHRARRDEIIRSYGDAPVWGFKCPRTLLTLEFWREAIPRLSFVGTFRHPLLVAESLARRNGGEITDWLSLWSMYNQRLVALHEANPFPVVRFDTDPEAYRRSLESVIARLGFRPVSELTFFEPVLRHHVEPPSAELPPEVARLYARLCEIMV